MAEFEEYTVTGYDGEEYTVVDKVVEATAPQEEPEDDSWFEDDPERDAREYPNGLVPVGDIGFYQSYSAEPPF